MRCACSRMQVAWGTKVTSRGYDHDRGRSDSACLGTDSHQREDIRKVLAGGRGVDDASWRRRQRLRGHLRRMKLI